MLTVGLSLLPLYYPPPVYFSHSFQCTPYYTLVQLISKLFSEIQGSEDSSFASKLYSSSTTVASSTVLVIMHYINKTELNCKGVNCSSSLGSKHSLKMGPTLCFFPLPLWGVAFRGFPQSANQLAQDVDHDWKQVYIIFFLKSMLHNLLMVMQFKWRQKQACTALMSFWQKLMCLDVRYIVLRNTEM